MCYPTPCAKCGKTTWGGCGRHVENVMRTVPASKRCTCTDRSTAEPTGGLFRGLFGR